MCVVRVIIRCRWFHIWAYHYLHYVSKTDWVFRCSVSIYGGWSRYWKGCRSFWYASVTLRVRGSVTCYLYAVMIKLACYNILSCVITDRGTERSHSKMPEWACDSKISNQVRVSWTGVPNFKWAVKYSTFWRVANQTWHFPHAHYIWNRGNSTRELSAPVEASTTCEFSSITRFSGDSGWSSLHKNEYGGENEGNTVR